MIELNVCKRKSGLVNVGERERENVCKRKSGLVNVEEWEWEWDVYFVHVYFYDHRCAKVTIFSFISPLSERHWHKL